MDTSRNPGLFDNSSSKQRLIKEYSDQLRDIDRKMIDQVREMISHARLIFWMNLAVYVVLFVITISVLFVNLNTLSASNSIGIRETISLGICVGSLLLLIILFFRNPIH